MLSAVAPLPPSPRPLSPTQPPPTPSTCPDSNDAELRLLSLAYASLTAILADGLASVEVASAEEGGSVRVAVLRCHFPFLDVTALLCDVTRLRKSSEECIEGFKKDEGSKGDGGECRGGRKCSGRRARSEGSKDGNVNTKTPPSQEAATRNPPAVDGAGGEVNDASRSTATRKRRGRHRTIPASKGSEVEKEGIADSGGASGRSLRADVELETKGVIKAYSTDADDDSDASSACQELNSHFILPKCPKPPTEAWEARFADLVAFSDLYGHCDVLSSKDGGGKEHEGLRKWAQQQLYSHKRSKLGEEKVRRLEKIGFDLSPPAARRGPSRVWESRFEELVKFRDRCGHCNVPKKDNEGGQYSLYGWAHRQRIAYDRSELSDAKKRRLEDIGFKFAFQKGSCAWESRFEELVAFKEKFGHCDIFSAKVGGHGDDHDDGGGEYDALRKWAHLQRGNYSRSKLGEAKVRRLEEIGFDFSAPELPKAPSNAWESHFEELVKYRDQHGHCNVSSRKRDDGGRYSYLRSWVYRQRKDYSQSKLSEEKIRRLEEIGFNFALQKSTYHSWDSRFEEMVAFRDKYGHCDTSPEGGDSGDDMCADLREWANWQRKAHQQSRLNDEKTRRLQEIGFDFALQRSNVSGAWESRFEELVAMKEKFGHCDILSSAIGDEERPSRGLRKWLLRQRRRHRLSRLSEEEVRRLEEIGFDLTGEEVESLKEKRGRDFETWIGMLEAFRKEHGHCRVPISEGNVRTELGLAVQKIRYEYKRMKAGQECVLNMDRLARLSELGFVFHTRPEGVVSWEERMEQCRKFREEHGHLKIPLDHPELGMWVHNTRSKYKQNLAGTKTSLTAKRQAQLDEMGFVWLAGQRWTPVANTKSWEVRLQEFIEFREAHGHPFVPQHYPGGLGRWVSMQRMGYKRLKEGKRKNGKPPMTAEQALTLADAGFAWDASFIRRTPTSVGDMVEIEGRKAQVAVEKVALRVSGENDDTKQTSAGIYIECNEGVIDSQVY